MANTVIQLKHSTLTGNVPSSLANGEISINSRDGKFFYSTPAGVVVTHYPYPGPAGLNQEVQFNDSGVLGSDSGLTYNKTTDVITVVGGAIVGGVNVTPQIQLAFTQANTPSHVANSAASYANGAFGKANTAAVAANTPSHVSNSAASYANSSFARANNSLDANNGGTVTGTITATSFITTGSFGNILGANTIFANNFVANTGFIQFSDGSRQFTANGGNANTITAAFNTANAAFLQANTPSATANSAASYANSAFLAANNSAGVNLTQNTNITNAGTYANSAFLVANTPSHVSNSAASYANSGFAVANSAALYANSAFTRANNSLNANTGGSITGDISITGNLTVTGNTTYTNTRTVLIADNIITVNAAIDQAAQPAVNAGIEVDRGAQPNSSFLWIETSGKWAANNGNGSIFIAADSAESYANGAFVKANNEGGVNATQNTNITNAGTYANSGFAVANSAASYANSAFLVANTPSHVANSAALYANSAFAKANNEGGVNATQNTNITNAGTYANSGFAVANSASSTANFAFLAANTADAKAVTAGSYANSGFTQANSNYTSAVTKLDVTNSGSSAYLIDQYNNVANQTIYVSAGETIAFNLNVSGHPFVIRESSGGANTSNGLTHVSTTGVVSTGASAQGKVSGVLYWKVDFSLAGSTYVYQCTIHGGMVGNIVIQQPASFVAANTTLAFIAANTPSHVANSAASYANGAFAAANSAGGAASAGSYANSAFATANSSGSYANSAFAAANSASGATSAGTYANSAFLAANTPSHVANSAASYANSAFSTANTTITVGSYANSAFTLANSANIIAQGAYNFANTISGGSAIDNVARTSANSAGSYANSAFIHANSAFAVANTGGVTIGDVLALSIALG